VRQDEWPFEDAPNTATYTTAAILERRAPILLVTHDADDGAWQFHGAGGAPDITEARVIGLDCAVGLDPSLVELRDLPLGWRAYRDAPGAPWIREPRPKDADDEDD
jgi:hypothetical protein